MPDNTYEAQDDVLDAGLLGGTATQPAAPVARVDREFTVKARTQREMVWRRFRSHKLAMTSSVLLILVFVFAFGVAAVWKYKFADITEDNLVGPSGTHPLGTDNLGHDYLALVMRGTQRSLEVALFVAFFSTVIGTIVGAVAGFFRGWVDTLLMRIVDLVFTLPLLAVTAILTVKYGRSANGWFGVSVVLAALLWTIGARVIRSQVLSIREKEYIEAAKALGASNTRIIFRHIIPNCAGPIIVFATLTVASAILIESALSFLGFGVQPPDVSLGLLINQWQDAADSGYPWLFWPPGIMIILIALTINFIGDGLRDALDPTQTKVRA